MIALHALVGSCRRLGIPSKSNLPIVEDLVRDFVDKARALAGWASADAEWAAQAAFDLSFLALLAGEDSTSDTTIAKLLAKVSRLPRP
jgi:hypothetical protein